LGEDIVGDPLNLLTVAYTFRAHRSKPGAHTLSFTAWFILALVIAAFAGGVLFTRLGLNRNFLSASATDLPEEDKPTEGGRKPRYVDENVIFTVYRPKVVAPRRWYTLLAFAHLSEKRRDAPPEAPDPVEEVKRIAERFYGDDVPRQLLTQQQSRRAIPEAELLTFVPNVEGIEFNPEKVEFRWLKDVQCADFEMRAAAGSEGKTLRGSLTVYVGLFILADVPLAIEVDSARAAAPAAPGSPFDSTSAPPYERIFASYSHKDTEVVERFEAYIQSLGHQYLRDNYSLHSGEVWSEALARLIDEAQVFQLFWSHNSMQSVFVRQEWEHALSLGRPNFVRPVYWEEPFPKDKDLPPEKLAAIHFYKFTQSPPVSPLRKLSNFVWSQEGVKAVALAGFACVMLSIAFLATLPVLRGGGDNTNASARNANVAVNTNAGANDNANVNANSNTRNWNMTHEGYNKNESSYRAEAKGRGETIGQDMEDGWIHFKVRGALASASDVPSTGISVDVEKKVVTLRGTVATKEQKEKAERAAHVDGATKVIDRLEVKPEGNTNSNKNANSNAKAANSNKK
jgi:hypothetical protein